MSIWSDRDLERWYQEAALKGVWAKENGDSNGFHKLAEAELFDAEPYGSHAYKVTRKMGTFLLHAALQMSPAVPTPAVDHIRAAALISAAAAVVPPQSGSIDTDLTDQTIKNVTWTEGLMQRMHVVAIARILQGLEAAKGSTGF